MSKLPVHGMDGAQVGDCEFSDELLLSDRGDQAVHDVIVAYQAGRRAGTASTLSKGEVAGTGAKPWKQKGTGRARAGYKQSPVWRGGAVAFGPKPRSYAVKVNRKVARLAFQRVLSARIEDGAVKIVDALSVPECKTKHVVGLLKALGVERGALIVMDKLDTDLALAARNVPRTEVVMAKDVHAYQLLRYPVLITSREGLEALGRRIGGEVKETA